MAAPWAAGGAGRGAAGQCRRCGRAARCPGRSPPRRPGRSRCRAKAWAGAAGAAARAAGRAPSGLLVRLRSRSATLDASTQWTSAPGRRSAPAASSGRERRATARVHAPELGADSPGRGAATGPAGSLVRVSGAVCPVWSVRERRTIERPRSACRPAGPGSARSSTPCAQLSRRAVPEPCRKPPTRPIRGT